MHYIKDNVHIETTLYRDNDAKRTIALIAFSSDNTGNDTHGDKSVVDSVTKQINADTHWTQHEPAARRNSALQYLDTIQQKPFAIRAYIVGNNKADMKKAEATLEDSIKYVRAKPVYQTSSASHPSSLVEEASITSHNDLDPDLKF